jgi:hypothetical protein
MPKVRALLLSALFVGLAGCNGGDSTGPKVAEIIITPDASVIQFLGSTEQFSARVVDTKGSVMTGVTLTWSSSDPSVASVDQTGRATALAEGSVQITASAEGISGSAALQVDAADCTTDITLAEGEWEILPVDCAISIPSGSLGDRYSVAVLNQNLTGTASSVTQVNLTTGLVTGAAASPVLAAAPQQVPPALLARDTPPLRLSPRQTKHVRWIEGLRRNTRARHDRLRASEANLIQALGSDAVLPDLSAGTPGAPPVARQVVDLPAKLQLRPNPGNSCTIEEQPATAILLAQNDDMAIYQDSTQNANAEREATAEQAQWMLDYYSAYGKGTIDQYFPGVPDVDGNGKIIVYLSFFDDLSGGATAAYVWGGDLLSADDCAASNEMEVTYFNTALVRALDEGFEQALETVVHEVKHISSFWHGIARNNWFSGNPFQPSWLEEGTAEIAGNMSSRRAWAALGGPAPNAQVTEDTFRDLAFDPITDEFYPEVLGVLIRMNRSQSYLSSQPNALVVSPNGAADGHSVYGSGWTFLRWLGDVYGGAGSSPYADGSLFDSQNDSLTAPGIAGLETVTGKAFQALLEEYALGVMGHMGPSEDPAYAYTSYDFKSAIEMWCFAAAPGEDPNNSCGNASGPEGSWPWPLTAADDGTNYVNFGDRTYNGSIGPTGIRVHEFRSSGAGAGISLRITATQPAKVIVLRLE